MVELQHRTADVERDSKSTAGSVPSSTHCILEVTGGIHLDHKQHAVAALLEDAFEIAEVFGSYLPNSRTVPLD